MKAFLQVLGACSGDAPANVLLFFDDARYMFECGEGTQRFCNAHRVKIASGKFRRLFLTSLSPTRSIGGMLGMLLTVADAGSRALTVTAPHGLRDFMHAARPFYYRPQFTLTLDAPSYDTPDTAKIVCKDEYVTVTAVLLRAAASAPTTTPPESPVSPTPAKRQCTSHVAHSPVMAYHCKLHDLPGRFDAAAAKKLGIPTGPLFAVLARGESITIPGTDTRVDSDQVVGPSSPGPAVVVVSIPHETYLAALLGDEASAALVPETSTQKVCVVHMSPRHIVQDPRYQQWLAKFDQDQVTHLAHHESWRPQGHDPPTAFGTSAENVARLQLVGAAPYFKIKPQLINEDPTPSAHPATPPASFSTLPGPNWAMAESMLRYNLAPADSIGLSSAEAQPVTIDLQRLREDVKQNTAMLKDMLPIQRLRRAFAQKATSRNDPVESPPSEFPKRPLHPPSKDGTPDCLAGITRETASIQFLGTGSALPGTMRNVSAIFLDLFERGAVLLDAGEGTFGQLVRAHGWARADQIISKLRMVWISHMHADHHLGLVGILERRQSLGVEAPLVIVGPRDMEPWLATSSRTVPEPFRFLFFDNAKLVHPENPEANYFPQNLGFRVEAVEVIHCRDAYGLVLEDCIHGWTIAYSGDTRPCRRFASRAAGATVLIHEATMSSDMRNEAIEKFHSTTTEALQVAASVRPYRTILTHFSQRFKVPAFFESDYLAEQNAVVAYDFFEVNFMDLQKLPLALPSLLAVYPANGGNELVDFEDDAVARART